MNIFGVLSMIGGLAMFLYGMNVMGDGLAKLSGGKLEGLLEKLTSKKLFALLLGTLVTAIIQSSSATTVMVVGFVNSGIMQLNQAVGIIMGANIGTTITSWILSLTGISGDSVFIHMLKPSSFSPVLAAIGIVLLMTAKEGDKKKDIASILLGFAVLMFGMETMSSAVSPLSENESFTGILTMFKNPVLGMAAGAVLTAIIQSSSASVGILQALCLTGAVPYGAVVPIIMGQNIGTCITAILSSIGGSKNAKRASMIHLYFNLIGTIIFMCGFYGLNVFMNFAFLESAASAVGIAVIHSAFNIGCALILCPFSGVLVKLAVLTIRDGKEEEVEMKVSIPASLKALDERFLDNTAYAMELCKKATIDMAENVRDCAAVAFSVIDEYNEKYVKLVAEMGESIKSYEDSIGMYLVNLSKRNLSNEDSRQLSIILHLSSELERISNQCGSLTVTMKNMSDNKEGFSMDAKKELKILILALSEIISHICEAMENDDENQMIQIINLDKIVRNLGKEIRQRHIERLCQGQCTMGYGMLLEDTVIDMENISEHSLKIAEYLLEGEDTQIIVSNDKNTRKNMEEMKVLKAKYTLP